jgi:hypothetical protein
MVVLLRKWVLLLNSTVTRYHTRLKCKQVIHFILTGEPVFQYIISGQVDIIVSVDI